MRVGVLVISVPAVRFGAAITVVRVSTFAPLNPPVEPDSPSPARLLEGLSVSRPARRGKGLVREVPVTARAQVRAHREATPAHLAPRTTERAVSVD